MADFLFPELEADHQNTKQVEELKQARKLCRSTDPETSKVAAQKHLQSGVAASHRERVIDAVFQLGNATNGEIAALTGLDYHEVARRAPEAREAGQIRNGIERECRERKSKCQTWEPS